MQDNKNTQGSKPKFNPYWIYAIIAVLLISINFFDIGGSPQTISEDKFLEYVEKGHVSKVVIVNNAFAEVFIIKDSLQTHGEKASNSPLGLPNTGPQYKHQIGPSTDNFDAALRNAKDKAPNSAQMEILSEPRKSFIGPILSWIFPILIIVAIWIFIMRRVGGGAGGPGSQIFNIGKSKATLFDRDARVNVTFKDVAGLDEAKEEVMEVVDFLKNPKKYTALGGKIPKGVLLVGPPGTGKTLLAKAVAGEAGVPFFSISGSDFVEMFVGVGASRVRDLFKQAREKAPCIIFIDEIDAIGRARGRGAVQGNDERENTLNQLLVEMDGFSTEKGVILMAATNRPDILDSALLRPGRFDRQIGVDKPDLVGREQIFKVHLKSIKIGTDIDPKRLATQTPGFAGAEIANICNEAALIAARKQKKYVESDDFSDAIDRVIGGLEKKNKLISPQEKRVIAYHEAGHAISGWFLEYADPLVKVTIVPRGVAALGYAQYLPKEKYLTPKEELLDRMCGLLAGRAAEEVTFGRISTGAQNDLDRVTQIAYGMISIYGMNEKVGNVSFYAMRNNNQFEKPYSDETARLIDEEVRSLINEQYERAKQMLKEKRKELELIATELLNKEVLLKEDVERLIGNRPFDDIPGDNGEKAKGEDNGADTLQSDPEGDLPDPELT
ncbi:MAG: ATP-dependent zinc metalloprotease FtsH [Saprospiraceae bacterium]|nr:ATP-dependent zinc metalloprotease FtsH [Saprospiraceae bacterium]